MSRIYEQRDFFHKMELITDSPFFANIRKAINKYPDAPWDDALSWGQIHSKKWLIEELKKLDLDLGIVFILGGWLGTLPAMFYNDGGLKFSKLRSFDIDPSCCDIAEEVNKDPYVLKGWNFKATTEDMFDIDYVIGHLYHTKRFDGTLSELFDKPDTVINTSCEHIENFEEWWDLLCPGNLCILQSNNLLAGAGHVNCVKNIAEFQEMAPMSEVLFSGRKFIAEGSYTRFMLIGYK